MPARAIPGRLLVLCAVLFVVSPWWIAAFGAFAGSRNADHDALDFAVFYAAADLVGRGDGGLLYETDALMEVEHASIALPRNTTLAYLNPPFFAGLLAPLSLLPFGVAFQVWTLFNFALLAVACVLLWRLAKPLPLLARLPLVGGLAILPQAASTLQLGQFSMILLVSWLSSYALLRDGRDRAAGIALAPLLIKPELLLPVAALLLWKRRFGVFATLAPIAAAAVIASLAIVGIDGIVTYPAHLHEVSSSFTPATNSTQKMFGWTGILGATMGPEHAALQTLIAIPLAALTLAGVAWLWRGRFAPNGDMFPVQWLALTLGTLLCDPHLYHQDTLLLYPAIAIVVASAPERRRWAAPMLAATWLIGATGQSPNVNANVCAFGIMMAVSLAVVVWALRLSDRAASKREFTALDEARAAA
ncbi:MAG TPA: glycosyltransferase family 87 protein [Dehalococcoidia bacterium]|jgi:hypothetical protein|nr:glycosyltransferase family 87 protein [Dehalococcoidia bacterium]